MDTMKWYDIMNKTSMKSMSMFCEEESIRTRLASNLADFAWDMWNAAVKSTARMNTENILRKILDLRIQAV